MKKDINIELLRRLFIDRMTIDSETQDRRKKEYNQAIFFYDDYNKTYNPAWDCIDMEMVLKCFDDAVKDYNNIHKIITIKEDF